MTSEDPENEYWWSLTRHRVEKGPGTPNTERLGPFRTHEEAATAVERARQRTEEWDAQDREWEDR